MKKMFKINLEDFNLLIEQYEKGTATFDSETIYILTLDNCNGITIDILESYRQLPIDIKFKILGDMYNNSNKLAARDYNYNLDEMQQIISVFEEIGKDMPENLTEIGRFLYIYRILCECIDYQEIYPCDMDIFLETNGLQRSLYSTLLNGDGVCVGYALTLKNVLNYYNINCVQLHGIGHTNNGESGPHAWNAVEIDGKWYFVDLTWDAHNPIELPYCLMVSDEFVKSHELDRKYKDIEEGLADKDYDYSELITLMEICYDEFNLARVIERVKSHRIEKRKIETIGDMSVANLTKSLFEKIGKKYTIEVIKNALSETTTTKANEAFTVEQSKQNPEHTNEGEIKND